MPKIAIIQFPGSNCERETVLAVKRANMQPVEFLWNEPTTILNNCDGFIIVGGFSYEDRSRAGAIAALDPVIAVLREQNKLGKPILGICNGAQILVETGLVPGVENEKVSLALTDNKRIKDGNVLGIGYYNAWIHMRVSDQYQLNAFTQHLTPKQIMQIPVAHAEGRFIIPSALLKEIQAQGMNVFQYCDATGAIIDEFPVNPNGSVNNIAAISNKAGNVLAMMPHPERTSNGDAIFQSMREYIEKGHVQRVTPLVYYPRLPDIYKYKSKNYQCVVELIITDNHAMSVETALQRANIKAKIKRQIHWEIACDSEATLEQIKRSGVLFNDRKEKLVINHQKQKFSKKYLVRSKEDMHGLQKQQMLKHHFNIQGLETIQHGILWLIEADEQNIHKIIDSHILFNPVAQECYDCT
ncbi:phosphoribosylformylglycinamidine synthase [Gammaproteobacteria bacterium SCGC AG-212-F23]|nr:phosphoribosylformylglycinamidine synthase [Gammaproteobacteria bacterium SCGC AG-212-F23]